MRRLRAIYSYVRSRKWRFILAAIVLGLVSASVWHRQNAKANSGVTGETAVVTRGPLDITVEAKGQLEALETVNIFPEIDWGTLTFVIADGSEVKAGEVLAKLDTERYDEELKRLSLDVERERNELTRSEEELTKTRTSTETKLADAKLKADVARMALEQYGEVKLNGSNELDEAWYATAPDSQKGEAYQKFREAALAIVRANTNIDRAETDIKGMDQLLAKGYVTRDELASAELAVLEAQRGVESAKLAYDLLLKYTYPLELGRKKQDALAARNELRQTEMSTAVEVSNAEIRLRYARRDYERRSHDLDEIKGYIAKCTITAPVAGKVLYGDGNPWWKEYIGVGRQIWQGMRLFTIPNTASVAGRVRVLEIDVYQVKVGQAVKITLDALEGVVVEAKVSKVAEYASSQGGRWGIGQNTKVFDVELKFNAPDERLKTGMSCTANILLENIEDTTYVPMLAVFNKDGKKICYVVDGDKQTPVEVRIGKASEKHVEILDGLKPGQKVLLAESGPVQPGTPAPQRSAPLQPRGGG